MENGDLNREKIKKTILEFHLKGTIIDEKEGNSGIVYIVDKGENAVSPYIAYKTAKIKVNKFKLKNFIREARIWFKAKGHALILTPFYITHFEDLPLICMPFCDTDLEAYLKEKGKLSLIETLVFTTQILKALIYAESKGITAHQDLKPANILLEDISKKFIGFSSLNVHESMKFGVRLADFGLANAWKEIGIPKGTSPYMAPEQYTPDKYNAFNPDVFAVGVIMVEMLSGLHPCGKRTEKVWEEWRWKNKEWEKWAKNGERKIEIGTDDVAKDLENFLRKMLLPNPEERPSNEEALNKTISILSKLDGPTTEYLKLLFEYYDTWAGYFPNENRLDALIEISKLPRHLDIIIDELLEEISDLEKSITTPREAIYYCELCSTTSALLLKRKEEDDKEKVKNLAERMIEEAIRWKTEIKTCHKYPELKFKGITLIETPSRDFEVYAELIGYGRKLLENVKGKEETEKVFENKDNYTKSAYFYSIASDFHSRGEETKAIEILDKCIELNPEEAVFCYMRSLWTEHHLSEM